MARGGNGRPVDLLGGQFGAWRVVERAAAPSRNAYWLCECLCGTRRPVRGRLLVSGESRSCGARACQLALVNPAVPEAPGNGHWPAGEREFNGPVDVVAVQCGIYKDLLRPPGARFTFRLPDEYGLRVLPSWVRPVALDEPEPERSTSGQGALDQVMFERHGGRMPGHRISLPVTDDDDTSRALTEFDPWRDWED